MTNIKTTTDKRMKERKKEIKFSAINLDEKWLYVGAS